MILSLLVDHTLFVHPDPLQPAQSPFPKRHPRAPLKRYPTPS